jgi:hypothetical protein
LVLLVLNQVNLRTSTELARQQESEKTLLFSQAEYQL